MAVVSRLRPVSVLRPSGYVKDESLETPLAPPTSTYSPMWSWIRPKTGSGTGSEGARSSMPVPGSETMKPPVPPPPSEVCEKSFVAFLTVVMGTKRNASRSIRFLSPQAIEDGMRNALWASPSTGNETGPFVPTDVGSAPSLARTGDVARRARAKHRIPARGESLERISVRPESLERISVRSESLERISVRSESLERISVRPERGVAREARDDESKGVEPCRQALRLVVAS